MSNTVHLNITLPEDLAAKVKTSSNQSALIAESLREKFAREEKDKLSALLLKAYREAAEEDQKVNSEWETTIGDGLN
jgi:type IV secretory pathway VirB4 component